MLFCICNFLSNQSVNTRNVHFDYFCSCGSYLCDSNITPTAVHFLVSVCLCLCRMSSTQTTYHEWLQCSAHGRTSGKIGQKKKNKKQSLAGQPVHPYPKCLTALRNIQINQHQHLIIERLYTSSSLSDVSESVEAAGLLTGSSCSSESTRFLLARDSSSCKKQRKIESYHFFQAPIYKKKLLFESPFFAVH